MDVNLQRTLANWEFSSFGREMSDRFRAVEEEHDFNIQPGMLSLPESPDLEIRDDGDQSEPMVLMISMSTDAACWYLDQWNELWEHGCESARANVDELLEWMFEVIIDKVSIDDDEED